MLMGFSVPEVSSRDELVAYLRSNLIGPYGGEASRSANFPTGATSWEPFTLARPRTAFRQSMTTRTQRGAQPVMR